MPTPLVPAEKAAFIALVLVAPIPGGVSEAMRLSSTDFFNNYEDIPLAISRELYLFSGQPTYLAQCMAVFTDANLVSAGIYNAKNIGSPVTNPVLITNSTLVGGISITSNQPVLGIFFSTIGKINMTFGVFLSLLYVAGSTIDLLNANFSSAFVGKVELKNINNNPSTLKGIMMGSVMGGIVGQVLPDPGTTYGGVLAYDPDNPCTNQVANLSAGAITENNVTLMWVLSANPFLFINISYRLANSSGWISADNAAGDFIQQVGFVFRFLKPDTYYDFMVNAVCTNGGSASQKVTAQTVCCGDKTVSTQKECWFTVAILTTPGVSPFTTPNGDIVPVTITLCNGSQIAGQYAVGATLTIPYLANQNVDHTIILNNQFQQGIPYNSILGQWDLSSTPLVDFQNGDVVSIKATLPA